MHALLHLPARGSLAKLLQVPVVAVPSSQSVTRRRPLALIQGSLSSRRVARQAPWLAGLHKAADGLLLALGGSMLGLTALTLHWQGQWTQSYQKLESAQVLEHRLQEATAVLEQHHLREARRPGALVPTSIQRLVYLPAPSARAPVEPSPQALLRQVNATMGSVNHRLVHPGY